MKLIKLSIGFVALTISLGVGLNMYRFGYGFSDGFWRTLMSPFEETVWAPGFSEHSFVQVKLGMEANQVLAILGAPLRKDDDCSNICFWMYTHQATGTADFDQRWIVFDKDSKVIELRKSFFID